MSYVVFYENVNFRDELKFSFSHFHWLIEVTKRKQSYSVEVTLSLGQYLPLLAK